MGRFINLGIAIVNTSYIIRVEMESNGRAEIYMSDGTMFRCDHFDASQLYGTNETNGSYFPISRNKPGD